MTSRDYVKLAEAFKDCRRNLGHNQWDEAIAHVAHFIASACKADNHRFNHAKFYAACGLKDADLS